MTSHRIAGASLEEQVLRVLYERPCSAVECAAELGRYGGAPPDCIAEIGRLLADLEQRAYVRTVGPLLYALTPEGSERLAVLVEAA
jgi:DNA-binding PadR family transcriptional regulator